LRLAGGIGRRFRSIAASLGAHENLCQTIVSYNPFNFGAIIVALTNASRKFALLEREIDAWRCIEALRAHAASNGNQFPGSLSDIKGVPNPSQRYLKFCGLRLGSCNGI